MPEVSSLGNLQKEEYSKESVAKISNLQCIDMFQYTEALPIDMLQYIECFNIEVLQYIEAIQYIEACNISKHIKT